MLPVEVSATSRTAIAWSALAVNGFSLSTCLAGPQGGDVPAGVLGIDQRWPGRFDHREFGYPRRAEDADAARLAPLGARGFVRHTDRLASPALGPGMGSVTPIELAG